MSNAANTWSLLGDVFVRAIEETGKAIAESTHDAFQYMEEITRPEDATQQDQTKKE